MKQLAIALAAMCLLSCGSIGRMRVEGDIERYSGEGRLELLVRPNGFGSASYGYALALPYISTETSSETTYRLKGLPSWEGPVSVELATFTPIFGEPLAVADRRALPIPDDHKISCKLTEDGSGGVLGWFQGGLKDLGGSQTLQFKGAGFMKHLFAVDQLDGRSAGELSLFVAYDVGNSPLRGRLQIVIIRDAPGASF